jgi:hypothetical protein
MLIPGLLRFDFAYWTTWLVLGVGSTVAGLVFVTLRRYGAWRRLANYSREEDLPWDQLLDLLRDCERELAASHADKNLPPEQLLALLVARLPAESPRTRGDVPPEERQYLRRGGAEKRSGRRRWGNPTSVYLASPLLPHRLHGIVINRSTGGLGIFLDQKVQPGALIEVRAVDAPGYLPSVEVEVKYCRKVRRQVFIGCQFCEPIPWNIRVWFG